MMRGAATQPTFGHFYVAPKKGSRHSQKNRQVKAAQQINFFSGRKHHTSARAKGKAAVECARLGNWAELIH